MRKSWPFDANQRFYKYALEKRVKENLLFRSNFHFPFLFFFLASRAIYLTLVLPSGHFDPNQYYTLPPPLGHLDPIQCFTLLLPLYLLTYFTLWVQFDASN